MVNEWGSGSIFDALGLVEFALFWRPDGSHDYKARTDLYGSTAPMYDAFGNFEYGATGAALATTGQFFTSEEAFVGMGNLLHWGMNDRINTNDIASGYDAIASGGTLGVIYLPMP